MDSANGNVPYFKLLVAILLLCAGAYPFLFDDDSGGKVVGSRVEPGSHTPVARPNTEGPPPNCPPELPSSAPLTPERAIVLIDSFRADEDYSSLRELEREVLISFRETIASFDETGIDQRKLWIPVLVRLGSSEAVPDLRKIIEAEDQSETMRVAIRAYAELRPDDVNDVLLSLTENPDPSIRRVAIASIGFPGNVSAVGPLLEKMNADEEGYTADFAAALGRIGDPSCRDALLALLESRDPLVQESAAKAIGPMNTMDALPALRRMAYSDVRRTAEAAIDSLGRIQNTIIPSTIMEIVNTRADDGFIRVAAAKAFAYDHYSALPQIREWIRSDDDELVIACLFTIRKLPEEASVSAVMSVAKDTKLVKELRRSAINTLGSLPFDSSRNSLVLLLKGAEIDIACWAADALGRGGFKESSNALIEGLHSRVPQMQVSCADALGRLRAIDARPALMSVISDSRSPEIVKNACRVALAKISEEATGG
ncbi:MAG: HEAT repeat domain-containing protein [Planctomycetes bacterium]|nr:HEAT repeat domain-containing protein [Planctomycetota bacterium]